MSEVILTQTTSEIEEIPGTALREMSEPGYSSTKAASAIRLANTGRTWRVRVDSAYLLQDARMQATSATRSRYWRCLDVAFSPWTGLCLRAVKQSDA